MGLEGRPAPATACALFALRLKRGLDANGKLPDAQRMRGVIVATLLVLAGCGANMPTPTDIPVGGVRAPITQQNLVAAREGMPGGLLEPGWLPDGFVLVHADYIEAGNEIASVDLVYDGPDHQLHIWQTRISPAELGAQDPVPMGQPLQDTRWNANPLPAAQVGGDGVVEFSTRLEDGRTITLDSDLDEGTMRRVLDSLYFRNTGGSAS